MPEDTMLGGGAPEAAAEESAETVQVSADSLGGAKAGDTVTFTVQSIDPKSGMATLAPANEDEGAEAVDQTNTNPEPSAMTKAAGLFDEKE